MEPSNVGKVSNKQCPGTLELGLCTVKYHLACPSLKGKAMTPLVKVKSRKGLPGFIKLGRQ